MKVNVLLFFIFFSLTCLHSQKKITRAIAKESAFKGAQVSISVFDIEKQKFKVSFRSDVNILPASTIKLVTFLGALQIFDDKLPMLHYTKQKDRFYFWSSGYPLINHPKYNSNEVLKFLAKQNDSLFYIPRPMTSPALGSGWAWDDLEYEFSAKKSSFPIHGNLIQIISNTSEDNLEVSPPSFQESITYERSHLNYNININEHTYLLSSKKPDTLFVPFTPSEETLLNILEEKLERSIYIGQKKLVDKLEFKTLTDSKTSVYKALLHNSDNLVAESLVLMLSGTSQWELNTQGGILKIEKLNKLLFKEINQFDGSGLSRYNLISPKAIIKVLNELHRIIGTEGVKKYFPQLNHDGTLEDYAPNLPFKFVYAKTGSLKNNHILAGYLYSSSYKPYSFIISVNNYTGNYQNVKLAIAKQLFAIFNSLH